MLEAELGRGADHFLEMRDGVARRDRVRVQRVGIKAEGGEADAVPRAQGVDIIGLRLGEGLDVQVRDAGVFPLGLARRPAGDLEAGELVALGKVQHFG